MQFRFSHSLFFRSTVKLLVEILCEKALQFDVGSIPQCGPLADRWDVVVSKKKERSSPTILDPWMESWSPWRLSGLRKKGLHPKFGDLIWKPGILDGYVASPKMTKRSSTIIRGLQMESGTLRQLRESLTTLLWGLYNGPLKCSFMDSYTPMGPGQIAPCNPQPPLLSPGWGGLVVCLLYPWLQLGRSILQY